MTENHPYNTPEKGAKNWHVPLNQNFEQLDTDVEIRDVESNRSQYTPKAGAKFKATDTGAEFLGDGSNWSRLASTGRDPSFRSVSLQRPNGDAVTRELLSTYKNTSTSRLFDFNSGDITGYDLYEVQLVAADLDPQPKNLVCTVNETTGGYTYTEIARNEVKSRGGEQAWALYRESNNVTGFSSFLVSGGASWLDEATPITIAANTGYPPSTSGLVRGETSGSFDALESIQIRASGYQPAPITGKLAVYGLQFDV